MSTFFNSELYLFQPLLQVLLAVEGESVSGDELTHRISEKLHLMISEILKFPLFGKQSSEYLPSSQRLNQTGQMEEQLQDLEKTRSSSS